MLKEVGLWIDHRQAVMVITLDQEESIKRITSKIKKHVRYSGASQASSDGESHNDSSEGGKERRFDDQLNRYYDDVISYLDDATSILIMGPGEAKAELQKRLESHGLSDRVAAVKIADKMTDEQIAVSVRKHFQETHHSSKRIPQQ